MNRRQWLYGIGITAGALAQPDKSFAIAQDEPFETKHRPLNLSEFEPKSMLHVHESRIERARFPVIDFHTHITHAAKSANGVGLSAERNYAAPPDALLSAMGGGNIRTPMIYPAHFRIT